ncbi:MAG TPA: ATP-binding protein [Candidatus Lokiarchaeia archaeon]|nr:ATP-binding protein [Candidatus Lokiarchaeia archaeon]
MENITHALRSWNPWWIPGWTFSQTVSRIALKGVIDAEKLPHVKDIIGPRRAGKTTLLYQVIEILITDGVPSTHLILINFDDINFNSIPLESLTQELLRACPDGEYLFLDEVQEKTGWERWVRGMYDARVFRQIYVTGSSAALLSEDIGRVLTGRHVTFMLLPFSFREFLVFKGWNMFDANFLRAEHPRLLHHLDAYLAQGGFPEIAGRDDLQAHQVATMLFKDILARDVATRHVVDEQKIVAVAYYLMTNFAREFSLRKVGSSLNIHVETLEHYISYLVECFLVFPVSLYDYKLNVQFRTNKKYYAVDCGLRNHVGFQTAKNIGFIGENAVFLELKRRGKDVYYWKDGTHEVDFIAVEGGQPVTMIQVCWDVMDPKTLKREIDGLVAAGELLGISEGTLITQVEEKEEDHDGLHLRFKPLAYWLLEI